MKKYIMFLGLLILLSINLISFAETREVAGLTLEVGADERMTSITLGGITVSLSPAQSDAIVFSYMSNPETTISTINTFFSAIEKNDASLLIGAGNTGHENVSASITSNSVSVTCANGANDTVYYTRAIGSSGGGGGFTPMGGGGGDGGFTPMGGGGGDLGFTPMGGGGGDGGFTPYIPPAPVITTDERLNYGCNQYVSGWNPNWSDCVVNGVWTSDGNITCKQTVTYSPIYNSCGQQTCVTTYINGVPSGTSCGSCSGCSGDSPYPTFSEEIKTISLKVNNPVVDNFNAYANNRDFNYVKIFANGNTNQNKNIVNLGFQGNFAGFSSNKPSDLINNLGSALSINYNKSINSFSPGDEILNIPVKSTTPFVGLGSILFKAGNTDITINNVDFSYKKPFIGNVDTWNYSKNDWTGKTSIGTEIKYKLGIVGKSILSLNLLNNYSILNFSNQIVANGDGLEVQSNRIDLNTLNDYNGVSFYTRLNTDMSAKKLNEMPGIKIEFPIINYTLGGQNVKYYLTQNENGNDMTPIKSEGEGFSGIKILGLFQGQGKQEITMKKENISDISKLDFRTQIRKNAYLVIKNMLNGDTINGIKYVEGDINISGDLGYETLVVKNGNVIIDNNLNPQNKKLGIIVLKDNYSVDGGYLLKGNIFVKPNVTLINANIYADGGLISSNNLGLPYLYDNQERISKLGNQLFINGSLFTRNTIGGAILSGGYYLLPGGSKTDDFNKAMIYDLNYVRRGNNLCNKNTLGECIYKEPFIIKNSPKTLLNTPKLFIY